MVSTNVARLWETSTDSIVRTASRQSRSGDTDMRLERMYLQQSSRRLGGDKRIHDVLHGDGVGAKLPNLRIWSETHTTREHEAQVVSFVTNPAMAMPVTKWRSASQPPVVERKLRRDKLQSADLLLQNRRGCFGRLLFSNRCTSCRFSRPRMRNTTLGFRSTWTMSSKAKRNRSHRSAVLNLDLDRHVRHEGTAACADADLSELAKTQRSC